MKTKRINFLKLFALSHLTDVQKSHLSYAVRKDIESREIARLYFKQLRRWIKLKKRGGVIRPSIRPKEVSGFFFKFVSYLKTN